jgi:serine/threonine-protein kinase
LPAEWTDIAAMVGKQGVLSPKRSLQIIRQVAYSLEIASKKGQAACQISPEALLIRRDGRVRLALPDPNEKGPDNKDPGVHAAASPCAGSTNLDDYRAPEQAGGRHAADVRSQIYSLGCTWYFMLTGQPPFNASSRTYDLRDSAETSLPDPRGVNPEVSEAVLRLLRQMTAKQPSHRHPTLQALLADLTATSSVSNATVLEPLADPAVSRVLAKKAVAAKDELAVVEDEGSESFDDKQKSSRTRNRSKGPPPAEADRNVARPQVTSAGVLPRRRDQSLADERPKRDYTLPFYLGVGAVLVLIALGIVLLVQEFGTSFGRVEDEQMGNPFVHRAGVAKNAGSADLKPDQAVNSTIGDGQPSGDQAGSGTEAANVGITANTLIGGKNLSPETWARLKQEAAFLPGWATQPRPTDALVTFTVKPDSSGKNLFATLNQALDEVPVKGALIKLAGKGPFLLFPAKIIDKVRLVIEPESFADPAPVIALQIPNDSAASHFVEVSNTTLELRGVHLVLDGEGLSADPDDAVLSTVASDLFLRNCSLSVTGMSDARLSALKIAGTVTRSAEKTGRAPRVLIENTRIQGNKLTAVAINSDRVDVALWNSLIWSGKAEAIRFGNAVASDDDPLRSLHLASTTLCSRNCAVQIAGDARQPVRTSIELLNSLVASPAAGKNSSLLIMEGWNENQQEAACGTQITWQASASLYTGWKKLIQVNTGDRSVATSSPAEWLAAWQDASPEGIPAIQTDPWPDMPVGDIEWAGNEALAPQTLAKQYVQTDEGGRPGCQTERLPVNPMTFQRKRRSKVKRPSDGISVPVR